MLAITACTTNEKKTPSGLIFKVVKKGDGVLPKKGEIVVFDYTLKDSKDSVWRNTHEIGIPTAAMCGDSATLNQEDGMTQMLRMVSKGDSVTTTMSITDFFTKMVGGNVPFGMDTTLRLTYYLNIRNIMDKEQFNTFRIRSVNERQKKQRTREIAAIKKYLAEKNITAESDTTGLHYIIYNQTGGKKPLVENCVTVNYRGRLLKNGLEIDKNPSVTFPLGQVIEGWQLGIAKLGIGDSATLFIPSTLGYGPEGYQGIPRDATLIFDVKVLGVSEFDPATQTCK